MILPTVHFNGTSRDELLRQHVDAIQTIHAAIEAVQRAAPNGRDYYLQGESAIGQALYEYRDRLKRLESVLSELNTIAESL